MTAPGRSSTRMPAERRREQLLDVTKAIVVERGFHAVSIEAVARDAGISRPVVYGHFRDLPALLDALVERETLRALTQLATLLPEAADEDPPELLLGALRSYLRAVESDPATWRLMLMPPEGAPASLRERIAAARAAILRRLAEAIRPGLAPGRATPDPELVAHLLSALSDEAARLLLTEPDSFPVERSLALARWLLGRLAGRADEAGPALGGA